MEVFEPYCAADRQFDPAVYVHDGSNCTSPIRICAAERIASGDPLPLSRRAVSQAATNAVVTIKPANHRIAAPLPPTMLLTAESKPHCWLGSLSLAAVRPPICG